MSAVPSSLVNVSLNVIVDNAVLPVFTIVIVKTAVSLAPGKSSPLSINSPVFVTSITGLTEKSILVGSLTKFPSASFPSSLTSVISLVKPGELAVAVTVLRIHPESISTDPIVYVAV